MEAEVLGHLHGSTPVPFLRNWSIKMAGPGMRKERYEATSKAKGGWTGCFVAVGSFIGYMWFPH
jgi:hypothetical protein